MLRIPIKTYLFKYLQRKVGTGKLELKKINHYEVSDETEFWKKLLSDSIFPRLTSGENYKIDQIKYKNYQLMIFTPSDKMIRNKRLCISAQAIYNLNDRIYQEMMRELTMVCDGAISSGKRIDLTVIDFMNRYDIDEEDIRMDSLKKGYYRDRLRRNYRIPASDEFSGVVDLSFAGRLVQN